MVRFLWSVLLVGVALLPGLATAQTAAEGSLRGIVRDEQGTILTSVAITATSVSAPLPAATLTDSQGAYRLLSLAPGSYTVTARLQGFSEFVEHDVVVRAGLNVGLDIVMRVGNVTETVTVTQDAPLLESRRSVTAVNVSGNFQRGLPLSVRQHFYDFLQLVPSTVNQEAFNSTEYWVHGTQSHVFQLDGADIDAASTNRTVYLIGSPSVIADVHITTAGLEASMPLGQGAIVNVVTKSGTNTYHGVGSLLVQGKSWNSDNNPAGTTAGIRLMQPDVGVGGPIVRDRAWFFGNYRFAAIDQSVSRTPAQLTALQMLAPGFQPFDNTFRSNQIFIKPTMQLGSSHRMQFFEQYGTDNQQAAAPIDAQLFATQRLGGHAAAWRMDSVWNSRFTTRAGVVYNNQANPNYLRYQDRPSRVIFQSAPTSGAVLLGTNALAVLDNYRFTTYDAQSAKVTVTLDGTYHLPDFLGAHDLQAGLLIQPRRAVAAIDHIPNGGFQLEELVLTDPNDLRSPTIPFHRRITDQLSVSEISTNSEDYGSYVQDEWRATTRLTVTGGVRVDKIRRTDRNFGDRLQDTIAVGPRIGANLALDPHRRSSLRATFGIVHDATSNGVNTTAGTNTLGYTDLYDTNLDGVFETVVHTPGVTQRTLNRVIDLDTYRQPHSVDFTAGYARQLPGRVTLDASVIRRTYKDRPATVDVNGIYDGRVFQGYRSQDFNEIYQLTSNVWNWPVYTAWNVQLAHETSRLQFLASYTRQFRHFDGVYQPNDPASFIQPASFPDDKGIGSVMASVSNSLTGTAYTSSTGPQWQDHVARVAGSFVAPWGLLVAADYTLQSGPWSGPIVTRIAAPDPQFGPTLLTLSNGRQVTNPLSTQIRFAYADRGSGQLRLPAIQAVNLRAGRRLTLLGCHLDATVLVLNLLNGGNDYGFDPNATQLYSQSYGKTRGALQLPRSVQGSIRVEF